MVTTVTAAQMQPGDTIIEYGAAVWHSTPACGFTRERVTGVRLQYDLPEGEQPSVTHDILVDTESGRHIRFGAVQTFVVERHAAT